MKDLQGFVKYQRGLSFSRPVQAQVLAQGPFVKSVDRLRRSEDPSSDRTESLFRALKLIPKEYDEHALSAEEAANGLLGFYVPETAQLVVRGVDPNPLVRRVLVHELTHALQDQRFKLHRPALEDSADEAGLVLRSLAEGDALRIDGLYLDGMSADDRRNARLAEEQSFEIPRTSGPPALGRLSAFPYTAGSAFVDAVVAAGGQPKLDDAFKNPSVTSESVIHPDLFLKGHGPVEVALPPADAAAVGQGVMGELGLLLLLSESLPSSIAEEAAAGWGGDRFVLWRSGDSHCARVDIVMDGPSDRDELDRALRQWAPKHGAAQVESAGQLRVTACA